MTAAIVRSHASSPWQSRWQRLSAREQSAALRFVAQRPAAQFAYEFVRFGVKKAWACLFPVLMLLLMAGTFLLYPRDALLPRYDFITLAAIAIQALLIWTKLETWEEAKLIALYHLIGTSMELIKTAQGSWSYPEFNYLRIAGVPLFSGFLYAAIGSFMVRTWHLFEFRFDRHPPLWLLAALSSAIYLNFALNRWLPDIRVALYVAAALALAPCTIHYKVWQIHRRMPLLLAALLTTFFIWLAENIGTFSRAWIYPFQKQTWSIVPMKVYLGWFLFMIISYTLVVWLKRDEIWGRKRPPEAAHGAMSLPAQSNSRPE